MSRLFIALLLLFLVVNVKAQEFTEKQARDNLSFALRQYQKMLRQVESGTALARPAICRQIQSVCVPRALHGQQIQMEVPGKWTNGFYPGVLWKLLDANQRWLGQLDQSAEQRLLQHAMDAQHLLYPEVFRTDTHDLGFIVYDSFAEALAYTGLPSVLRGHYQRALQQARESLYSRYREDYGVIQSWDWSPAMKFPVATGRGVQAQAFDLQEQWQLPVIIDNMMNLELLLSSSNSQHRNAALSHALQTLQQHYFERTDDEGHSLLLAYHLYDPKLNQPGNWQGLGNYSAWARGQGWSLYGFATLMEYQQQLEMTPATQQRLQRHIDALSDTLFHLLADDPVPDWDFFAGNLQAPVLARNVEGGIVYSPMLDLCQQELPAHVSPYLDYQPLTLPKQILNPAEWPRLQQLRSLDGQPLITDEHLRPCGNEAYSLSRRIIPKDSSAAAVIAAGLYRLAMVSDKGLSKRYRALADLIMAELSSRYTSRGSPDSAEYRRGFVLMAATGNLPAASEIDTAIVYADFYFIEANMLRLMLD